MAECKIDRDSIKQSIANDIAIKATSSGLFERHGNFLVPTIDDDALINSALQYKDQVKDDISKKMLETSPRDFLRFVSNQYYGRSETGEVLELPLSEERITSLYGEDLVSIARKVYPLRTSEEQRGIISNINSSYLAEMIIPNPSGFYIINPADDIVDQALRTHNTQNSTEKPANEVNYILKSVEILSSDLAIQKFKRGDKAQWDLDKILTELQIPSAQKELLLTFGTRNREELIENLVANYSYTVEINVAKDKDFYQFYSNKSDWDGGDERREGDSPYIVMNGHTGETLLSFETEQEARNKAKELNESNPNNSSRYSNMTVPGGTNYTENEIRTPDITPSTKGHATFSTNQGIGWFRSDDMVINQIPIHQEKVDIDYEGGEPTKTRRILEIQSDLFQKDRDKVDLIGEKTKYIQEGDEGRHEPNHEEIWDRFYDWAEINNIEPDGEAKERFLELYNNGQDSTKNQFLQLLNKDNNWVGFFVKSIIQDSAKKGYENVLFPAGDTAAKVEGHDTIEDFIREREIRIKYNKQYLEEGVKDVSVPIEGEMRYNEVSFPLTEEDRNQLLNENAQLERELSAARAGTLKISSIVNFYETTIKNILDKRGYKPERIKDEHGNEWYAVKVTPEMAQQILFGNPLTDQQRFVLYNETELKNAAGTVEEETPLEWAGRLSPQKAQIKEFLKANPNAKVEWGDGNSRFDPNTNTIIISLPELYEISQSSGIPFRQLINYYIIHEMAHAASMHALEKGSNDQFIQELLDIAREYHKTNPFDDKLRQGILEDGLPYSMKNIDEFVADAFGNPYFQEYLRHIPYKKENLSLWDKLIDWVLSLFGMKRNSVYNAVVDYINSDKIQKDNLEGVITPKYQGMYMTYRGNPRDYISASYEYFTSTEIKDEVDEVFKKLPSAIAKLKDLQKVQNDPDQRRKIQQLLSAFNEVKGQDKVVPVYVNMLVSAAKLSKDLSDQMVAGVKIKDDLKRITILNSLLTSAQNLRFITPLVTDILAIMDREGFNKEALGTFVDQLRGIVSIEGSIRQNFVSAVTPSIRNYFSSLFPENQTAVTLRMQIDAINQKLSQDTISSKDKKFYEAKMKDLEKQLLKIPTSETFGKIFAGQYEDASAMQMWLDSPSVNAHPLIASLVSLLRDMDIKTSQEMIESENEHQRRLNKVVSLNNLSLRNPSETWSAALDEVSDIDEVTEGEDGVLSFKLIKRRMLTSQYDPKYLEEHFKFQAINDFYYEKFLEGKRENDEDKANKYYRLYTTNLKARQAFQKENSERRYMDGVYDMYDLLDKEISKSEDGKLILTSFRQERGDIFRQVEELQHQRDAATTFEDQKEYQDQIKQKYIELKEIRSVYTPSGEKKSGVELALSNIANEYYELRSKYGQSILTPEGQASFEREIQSLEDKLENGSISQEKYETLLNDITVTELEEEYFNKINEFTELIQEATEKISAVPELRAILGKVDKEAIKNGYKKIKALTQAFRDNDGIIDGILFSKVRPELIIQIKNIQQELENLKNKASRLKGLSIQDNIRLSELTKKFIDRNMSLDEEQELNNLRDERDNRKNLYNQNKKLIDDYYDLLSGLAELVDSSVSEYYVEEKDNQLNTVIKDLKEKVKQEVLYNQSLEEGAYYKKDDKWFKLINVDATSGERIVQEVPETADYSAIDRIVDEIAKSRSQSLLEGTQWWKDNHYTYYQWDREARGYFPKEKPIYIWTRTEPKNKAYIKAGKPSSKFKTYIVKDEFVNPNHKEILPFIPINKQNKFASPRYAALQKDKYMADYVEFLRSEYTNAQAFYPSEKKMGDLLPGIVTSEDELKVNTVNNLLKKSTYANLFNFSISDEGNEDTKMLLGASQSKYYVNKRILPTRFTGIVPIEKQSANLPGMILTFILATRKYNNLQSVHPALESLRTVVRNLPVQESVSLGSKFNLRGVVNAIKSENKRVTRTKETEQSNLSKTIDFVLDTFLYGQTKEQSVSQVLGMNLDWQKLSTNMKHLSSMAIFSFNSFLAIKNTLSAKIQGVINSNIGKGFYTNTDFAKAQWEAKNYTKDFVTDYKKFGNRSFIGQALEYFQVLRGTAYSAYGRRTQWTELKNAVDYLSVVKNMSEFELQVTQFLAMSRANKIKVGDREIPFLDAFEIKNGNFQMKEGISISQEQINAFIKKITYVNKYINGSYRQDERNKLQKTVLGDLAFYLNGYVMPGIMNRYGSTKYSIEGDQITRGYWRQAFRFIADLVKYRRGIAKQWGDMTIDEKKRVMRFLKEMGFIIGMAFLVGALGGGDDKKKLGREGTAFSLYMLALAMSVKSETETFAPLPSMGLNELSRKINSPFAALRQVSVIIQTLENGFGYIFNNPKAFYKSQGVRDGFHDPGDPKVVANFLKLIGYSGVQFNPLERVMRTRRAQQLR